MKFIAISVIQPWPWLILRPDIVGDEARAAARAADVMKPVENRGWETATRGWVLLHASSTRLTKADWVASAFFASQRGVEVPLQVQLDHGGIVGAIRIDGCERWVKSRWFVGPVGLVIGAAVPFAKMVPMKGALKFFPVPPVGGGAGGIELAEAVADQIRAVGLAGEFKL